MKLLFLSGSGMSLYKFRKELFQYLIMQGHEVLVSFSEDTYATSLEELGCRYISSQVERRGKNPCKDIILFLVYIRMIRKIRPDVVIPFAVKPNIYGGLACRIMKTAYFLNITGLGSAMEKKGVLQIFIRNLYKLIIKKSCCTFFQNTQNYTYFKEKHILKGKSKFLPGSGVNLMEYQYATYPEEGNTMRFLFMGRIMKEKGIEEFLHAAQKVKEQYTEVVFDLVGYYEENYMEMIRDYEERGIICFCGFQEEVYEYIKRASAIILPSYHEGMANTLLEASACGRPVLASRIAGCSETFEEGISGFGFRVRDVESLTNTIIKFIQLPYKKKMNMGMEARRKMESEFDRSIVIQAYMEELNSLSKEKTDLYTKIMNRSEKIAVIGLGYVGIPIAVAFSGKAEVIGFDINKEKIQLYQAGIDPTNEVGAFAIKNSEIFFTSDKTQLRKAKVFIIAVPTPIYADHTPDLTAIMTASRIVAENLTENSLVIYESTVYPGVTEEICIPILEKESGMKCGQDFSVGYSPERINPGDKEHRLDNIVKLVAGVDERTADSMAKLYGMIVSAGVYQVRNIKTAEAAKVIENAQRDINIAFMNELSIIFNKMGISMGEVLKAAATKWNFIKFTPGLVGGHCIGVDPYYLTYKAEQFGYHSQVILAGRRINDEMGKYIAENLVKKIILAHIPVKEVRIAILGFTFKENCPDTRNTKVMDIVKELKEYGLLPVITDPRADLEQVREDYGINLLPIEQIRDMDAVILSVAHEEYRKLSEKDISKLFRENAECRIIMDIKGILDKSSYEALGYLYWGLN